MIHIMNIIFVTPLTGVTNSISIEIDSELSENELIGSFLEKVMELSPENPSSFEFEYMNFSYEDFYSNTGTITPISISFGE